MNVRRVRFDVCNACCRLGGSVYSISKWLVEVQKVIFGNLKVSNSIVDARKVRFHFQKACRRFVNVRRVLYTTTKSVGLQRIGESV